MRSLWFISGLMLWLFAGFPANSSAYPQFQLSKGKTCTSCHFSPAGGGLLNSMGEFTSDEISAREGNSAFLHGAWTPPGWLQLGGDFRFAGGVGGRTDYGPKAAPKAIPMQSDFYARIKAGEFSANVTVGVRGGPGGNDSLSFLHAREHYLTWTHGKFYLRGGRLMAPYGLRLAEHPAYTRRYTGTGLFTETYGLSASYVVPSFEVHATGFVHDGWRDPVEPGDGGALYAEKRLGESVALGASARYAQSDYEARTQGGITGKLWLEDQHLLLQAQGDLIHQTFDNGPARNQLVGYLLGSFFAGNSWIFELGLGHFDENVHVKDLDRDAIDMNARYFAWTHWEFLLTSRVQTIALGSGGATYGYALLQVHYRM